MKIAIYQINMSRDYSRIAFESLDLLKMYQSSDKIDSRIYDRVFEGEVDCKDLEDVYRKFNLDHPEGYKGRSLSVSDVVQVVDEQGNSTFHFCDSIGFKEIDFDPNLTKESKVGKIKIVLCEPGKMARVAEIDNTLADFQKTVKGYIEQVCPYDGDVAIICNEEGKFNGMKFNRAIYSGPQDDKINDFIFGPFFICNRSGADYSSLNEGQLDRFMKEFKYPERLTRLNGKFRPVQYRPEPDLSR